MTDPVSTGAVWAGDYEFTEESVDLLFAPFVWAPSIKAEVVKLLIEHHESAIVARLTVPTGEARKVLLEGRSVAAKLAGWLCGLSGKEAGAVGAARQMFENGLPGALTFMELRRQVMFIEMALESALATRAERGRRANAYRLNFLRRLHELYQRSEGRPAVGLSRWAGEYAGPFLDIAFAALKATEGGSQDKQTIGRAIQDMRELSP